MTISETGSMKALLIAAVAALGAAACAAPGERGGEGAAEADAGPDPRLGPETNRICFPGSINGWRTIDGDDDAVILRARVRDEYRVEYSGPCRASDFRFAVTIGIENRPAGGCLNRTDRLLVRGPGDIVNRCFITQINEWNEDALEDEADEEEGDAEE